MLAGVDAARRLERANLEQVGAGMVAGGLLSAEDFSQFLTVIDEAGLGIALPPLVSAWGRRR